MRLQRFIYTKNATDSDNVSAEYVLIFHHNITKGDVFTSERDFLFANTKMKYSLFGFIDDSYKFDGEKFEFLLEYPDDNTHGFWLQNVNPRNAPNNSDIGYEDKGKNFKGNVPFIGLTQTYGPSATFIDGCQIGWYYSIGSKKTWAYGNSIPGSYGSGATLLYEVFLWLRIPSLSFLRSKLFAIQTCHVKSHLRYNLLAFVFLVYS